MFQRAMDELCGDEVVARFGPIGTIDDLYIDGAYWEVRYLVVASPGDQRARRMLLSSTCMSPAAPRGDQVPVNLSRIQVEHGAGIWPMESASSWLERRQLYSARAVVGLRVEARDGMAGRVADILVDDQHWTIDYLIADMVPPRRQVLVPLDWVGPLDAARGTLYLRRTRQELHGSPSP